MVVVPDVPDPGLSLTHKISDGTTPSQEMAIAANGAATASMVAGTAYVGRVSSGGVSTSNAATAAKATATVISANAGRLCRVLSTAAGNASSSNFTNIYDNNAAASGKVIGVIACNMAAGNSVDFQMPAEFGITVAGSAENPALTISYS